ncbi:MAG TPA: hypothetical protein VNV41_16500 [Candidatus Acidoferrales bacterium]|jgi:hypothetical protein|nr:hypothetical protein [Candidatus Acidoferrales bacterium]
MTSPLVLTSFDAVPEHMEQLGVIAKSMGLTRSALLRLLISQYVRRAAKRQAVAA